MTFWDPGGPVGISRFQPHLVSSSAVHYSFIINTISKLSHLLLPINMSFNYEFGTQRELPGSQFDPEPSICGLLEPGYK